MSERALPLRAAALLALAAGLVLAGTAEAQSWRTIRSSRQLWDREPVAVNVQYGAGELELRPGADGLLYQLDLRYDEEHFAPVTEFSQERRTLVLGLRSREGRRNLNLQEGSRAEITLSPQVPIALDLDFGAGEADIDLGGLGLRSVDVSTGASDTRIRFDRRNEVEAEHVSIEAGAASLQVSGLGNARARSYRFQGGVGSTVLDFSGEWSRDAAASVKMGLGSVRLRLPRGLGVRVTKDSFLTSFDSQGLVKRGDSFYSADWDAATHRLTIDIDAAFGSIEVEWID